MNPSNMGAILYHGLAGRPPFEGPVITVLSRLVNEEPPPPSKARPEVPADLEAICLRAMAKHPDDRYADMSSLCDDLERAVVGSVVPSITERLRVALQGILQQEVYTVEESPS